MQDFEDVGNRPLSMNDSLQLDFHCLPVVTYHQLVRHKHDIEVE
jgi:hypothetical protein